MLKNWMMILCSIVISIPTFAVCFILLIAKFICIDEVLTLSEIFISISVNLIIFSFYFEIIYLSKFNIFIQILQLIPYAALGKLNFVGAERVIERITYRGFELTSNDMLAVCDSVIFLLLFILNIILIVLEKQGQNPVIRIYNLINHCLCKSKKT